jgi:3-deoxy-D-manno-octulosonic-acid transferase
MYLAYSLLLTFGLLILIPHFLFQALVNGKYIAGLSQRLGSVDGLERSSKPVIWLHCVSVGETQAARPLVERLRNEFPEYAIVVSTITITGQNLAKKVFGSTTEAVFYFPFDWRWSARRALKKIRPDVVLIMETELWPNFLRECKAQSVPVALVNGRISQQSFRRYRMIRFFLSRVLSQLDFAVMQSAGDAERISALGMPQEKLFSSGNLKFDAEVVSTNDDATETLRKRFAIQPDIPWILAASTHDPEEKIVIDCFQLLRQKTRARLMIAPRHPERFQEVARLIEASGMSWSRRTHEAAQLDSTAEIILLDTIGELTAVYSLARVVFVGGSIVDWGGHNVLEPAAAGACVVTGANTQNFQAIVELLNEAKAIVQLPPLQTQTAAEALAHELTELLAAPERCAELGNRARDMVFQNRGAADRTIAIIKPLFKHSSRTSAHRETFPATNSSGS